MDSELSSNEEVDSSPKEETYIDYQDFALEIYDEQWQWKNSRICLST